MPPGDYFSRMTSLFHSRRSKQQIVQTILSPDAKRKVEIFRRDDGTFGFTALKWDDEESCWSPYGNYSICYAASAEDAEKEAKGRVEWLAQLQ